MTNGLTSSSWKGANGMIKPPSSSYQTIGKAAKFLKLDFSAEDMAAFAKEYEITTDSLRCIEELFVRMQENKQKNIVRTLLKLSRLPLKEPKTFDTFDFGRFHGKQADELENLPTLAALYASTNLALIGPQGIGKTHLAMAFGRECCNHALKTYFLKATELNQKLLQARKNGNVERVVKSLVKPSCLIIDELGYCNFDTENTRIFFDIVDRRYSKDTLNTMIVTSNTEPDKWVTFFNDEPALKCAMDRFFDKALLISMKGRSYRGNCRRKIEVVAGNGMTQKSEQSNY